VSTAFDGRAGLEFATSSDFDAIILDLMLPGLDGFEVARRLRKRQNQTPIWCLQRAMRSRILQSIRLGCR